MKRLLGLLLITLLLLSCQSNEKNEVDNNVEGDKETLEEVINASNKEDDVDKDIVEEDDTKDDSSTKEEELDDSLYALIQVDVLNVRNEPDISGYKIGKTLKGQVYKVIEIKEDYEKNIWYKVAGDYGRFGWIASWYCEVVDYENTLHPVIGNLNDDVSKTVLKMLTQNSTPVDVELQEKNSGILTYQDKFRKYYKGNEYALGFVFRYDVIEDFITDLAYITLENGSSISGIHNQMTMDEVRDKLGWPLYAKYSVYDGIEDKYIDTDVYLYSLDDYDIRLFVDDGFMETVKSIEVAKKGEFLGWLAINSNSLNVREYPSLESDVIGKAYEKNIYSYSDYIVKSDDQNWYSINYNNSVAWVSEDYIDKFNKSDLEANKQIERDYEAKREVETNRIYTERLYDISDTFTLPIDNNEDGLYEEMQVTITQVNEYSSYSMIEEILISIGGISETFSSDGSGSYSTEISGVGIANLYDNDQKIQFFVRHGELADRMYYVFYEVRDQEFVEIFRFNSLIMSITDDGKMYYWGGNLYESYYNDFSKDLVLEYFDINEKEYKKTNQIVGKRISAMEVTIVYKEYEDVLDGAPSTLEDQLEYSKDKRHEVLEIGEKFVVLEIRGRIAKIRTENGNEGWIGGFHMIWD